MTSPSLRRPATLGREEVRRRLGGLSLEDLEDAVAARLLQRTAARRSDATAVEAAEADLEAWRQRLSVERRLNATDAAARLGVLVARFHRAVEAGPIRHVASMPWKWGTIWLYRGGDVDRLAGRLTVDAAERHVTTASRRSAAARRGAETRRRNAERAKAFRAAVAAVEPTPRSGPIEVVTYAAAMLAGFDRGGRRVGRFGHATAVEQLAGSFRFARFSQAEQEEMCQVWQANGVEAEALLMRSKVVEADLGCHPGSRSSRVSHLAGFVARRDIENLIATDPAFVERAREKERERQVLEEVEHLATKEAERVAHERTAAEADALLSVLGPGAGAHPVEVARFGLALMRACGRTSKLCSDTRKAMGSRSVVEQEIGPLAHRLTDPFQIAGHGASDIAEVWSDWEDRVLAALRELTPFGSGLEGYLRGSRLRLLSELGVVDLGNLGNLVRAGDVRAILAADPELAARWERGDEAARERARERAKVKAQRHAVRAVAKARHEEAWRGEWTRLVDVAAESVPKRLDPSTPAAVAAAWDHPPRWLLEARR